MRGMWNGMANTRQAYEARDLGEGGGIRMIGDKWDKCNVLLFE